MLNKEMNRKNIMEYLKEFNKSIPVKKSFLGTKKNVDVSKLENIKDKIELFYERGALISPMSIDKNSIQSLKEAIELVQQFPQNIKPEMVMENKIARQTKNVKKTRTILLPNVMENNSKILEDYDKMVAYYLQFGGDKPVERFSKLEMAMKQYGAKPDIGVSIMKYGDEITTKLEEINITRQKSPKEWEYFREQVIHSFVIAEKIGNRNVNREEHKNWEERLIKLGILERKIEKEENKEFKESIQYDLLSKNSNDKDRSKQTVSLENALQKNAEQMYINTGMVPNGYIKDENGKITRIKPRIKEDERANRLSATKNTISTNKKEKQQLTR